MHPELMLFALAALHGKNLFVSRPARIRDAYACIKFTHNENDNQSIATNNNNNNANANNNNNSTEPLAYMKTDNDCDSNWRHMTLKYLNGTSVFTYSLEEFIDDGGGDGDNVISMYKEDCNILFFKIRYFYRNNIAADVAADSIDTQWTPLIWNLNGANGGYAGNSNICYYTISSLIIIIIILLFSHTVICTSSCYKLKCNLAEINI